MVGRTLVFFLFIVGVNTSCPRGSLEWKSNCYYFNASASGFANAEIVCLQKGGHLASIHDRFTDDVISQSAPNYFHESTVNDFWIGVNDLETTNSWEWTDGSNFGDYQNWGRGQPVNRTGYYCGVMSMLNGAGAVANCFKLKPFVCAVLNGAPQTTAIPSTTASTRLPSTTYPATKTSKTPSTTPISLGKCSDGWVYFDQARAYYCISENSYLDFNSAEYHCQTLDSHLASIHSFAELQFLTPYVIADPCRSSWLGFYSRDKGSTWLWTDGTPFDYAHWWPGFPVPNDGQYCGILQSECAQGDEGLFATQPCSTLWRAICKKSESKKSL